MITIILPISRTDYLRPVFNCLAELEKPEDTELLIITDGDESLTRAVDRRLDSINFKRIRVASFGDKPEEHIHQRRYRIAAIHNKAKRFINYQSEYVFLIEDDTTYPSNTLTKMLEVIKLSSDYAFVEGVELGRHATKYIGAWHCDDVFEPVHILSTMPTYENAIEAIDAGGLYCCLVDADEYREHTFGPFVKEDIKGLSSDLNFGLWLRRKGRMCLLDWSIHCDHIGDKGSVNLGNTKPVQVVFEKVANRWEGRTEV